MSEKLKVAVIGVGNIGTAVTTNLVKGGWSIIVASREIKKAKELAQKLGDKVTPMEVRNAVKAAFQQPERAVEFYAADDISISAQIEDLIRDNGFEPVRIGGINQSIRIEVFGDLHEFGALGKTVTLEEAKNLL